jgi:hypothetical protein
MSPFFTWRHKLKTKLEKEGYRVVRSVEEPFLYVIAAVLTVFPGSAPADPMKVHDVLFATFWADALDLGLVAADNHLEFVVGALY